MTKSHSRASSSQKPALQHITQHMVQTMSPKKSCFRTHGFRGRSRGESTGGSRSETRGGSRIDRGGARVASWVSPGVDRGGSRTASGAGSRASQWWVQGWVQGWACCGSRGREKSLDCKAWTSAGQLSGQPSCSNG